MVCPSCVRKYIHTVFQSTHSDSPPYPLSGGPLERGLRRVLNDVPIGSLLIQSDAQSGEPLLLHLSLPQCVRARHLAENTYVFLLDAQIGTAASAFMAIRVLLDHGIRQDHIIFVTFLVAQKGGICVLRKAFPQVQVVCGAVDEGLRETWLEAIEEGEGQDGAEARKVWVVEPGMGHIGVFSHFPSVLPTR